MRGEEQNREEVEMAQTKLGGGRNRENQSATVVTRGYESYRDCLKLALIVG